MSCSSTVLRISFTTPFRSLPATLAETTILRCTFSRLMVLGPDKGKISATYSRGTFRPLAV